MPVPSPSNRAADLRSFLSSRKGYWKSYLLDGEVELRVALKYVRKGSVALDVGGCIGTYAYHLARRAETVYVFEPNPQMAERIRRSQIKNAIVENVALSAEAGTGRLRIPKLASGRVEKGMASLESHVVDDAAAAEIVDVPLRRIDDYHFKGVSFIKIDVEGHEEAVVAGALDTIKGSQPVLLIEIEERHNKGGLARLDATLGDLGYRTYFFDNGRLAPLSEFDQERDQHFTPLIDETKGGTRAKGEVRYINNFFFLPARS